MPRLKWSTARRSLAARLDKLKVPTAIAVRLRETRVGLALGAATCLAGRPGNGRLWETPGCNAWPPTPAAQPTDVPSITLPIDPADRRASAGRALGSAPRECRHGRGSAATSVRIPGALERPAAGMSPQPLLQRLPLQPSREQVAIATGDGARAAPPTGSVLARPMSSPTCCMTVPGAPPSVLLLPHSSHGMHA